ncbi:MAG: GNAT family N-acetyltransferase [Pseudomonadota bacterium]
MIEIRPAGPGDRAAVRALLAAGHLHYFRDPLPEESLETAATDILDRRSCTMLLLLAEGEQAGFATFTILQASPNGHGVLFLKDLFLKEAWRGGGLGRQMMAHLAGIAQDHGCARLDWTTETDNPGAMRLYERLGAEVVTEKIYYRVLARDLARFRKSCGDPS